MHILRPHLHLLILIIYMFHSFLPLPQVSGELGPRSQTIRQRKGICHQSCAEGHLAASNCLHRPQSQLLCFDHSQSGKGSLTFQSKTCCNDKFPKKYGVVFPSICPCYHCITPKPLFYKYGQIPVIVLLERCIAGDQSSQSAAA